MKIWFIIFSSRAPIIKAYGTAVVVVCVTSAAIRPLVPFVGRVPIAIGMSR